MRVIHKYPVINGYTRLPRGAKLLSIALQHGKLFCWAEVDPEELEFENRFYGATTGEALPKSISGPNVIPATFIGTFQMNGETYVLHVYGLPV